jgi:hypothetical protein
MYIILVVIRFRPRSLCDAVCFADFQLCIYLYRAIAVSVFGLKCQPRVNSWGKTELASYISSLCAADYSYTCQFLSSMPKKYINFSFPLLWKLAIICLFLLKVCGVFKLKSYWFKRFWKPLEKRICEPLVVTWTGVSKPLETCSCGRSYSYKVTPLRT